MTLGTRVFFGAFVLAVVVVFGLLLRISASGPGQGGSPADHRPAPGTVYRCSTDKRCDQVYPKP
jgi:hypothetical protein